MKENVSGCFFSEHSVLLIGIAYSLSIGTKIDDLGWPWTAISLNF